MRLNSLSLRRTLAVAWWPVTVIAIWLTVAVLTRRQWKIAATPIMVAACIGFPTAELLRRLRRERAAKVVQGGSLAIAALAIVYVGWLLVQQ